MIFLLLNLVPRWEGRKLIIHSTNAFAQYDDGDGGDDDGGYGGEGSGSNGNDNDGDNGNNNGYGDNNGNNGDDPPPPPPDDDCCSVLNTADPNAPNGPTNPDCGCYETFITENYGPLPAENSIIQSPDANTCVADVIAEVALYFGWDSSYTNVSTIIDAYVTSLVGPNADADTYAAALYQVDQNGIPTSALTALIDNYFPTVPITDGYSLVSAIEAGIPVMGVFDTGIGEHGDHAVFITGISENSSLVSYYDSATGTYGTLASEYFISLTAMLPL